MKLHEFEYNFNVRLTKVNKQFTTMNNVLEAKKQAFIEIYRRDPRISHDDAISSLQTTIEDFDPLNPVGWQNAQLENLQKQLAQQQKIVVEAGEMKIRLVKTEREKINLEHRLNELQSILDNEATEKSNLAKELKEIKDLNSNLKIENEKMAKDLKAVNLSRSEADGERKRLEGILQQTQARLQDAERVKADQSEKIKKLERDLKVADPKRGGISAKEGSPRGAAKPVAAASLIDSKQTIVCDSFSDDNKNVTVSSCKRRVRGNYRYWGYCFLNHPQIKKNQILQWSLRVPKFELANIGMVIILEQIIFHFLKITCQSYWYICQSTNGRLETVLVHKIGSEYYCL